MPLLLLLISISNENTSGHDNFPYTPADSVHYNILKPLYIFHERLITQPIIWHGICNELFDSREHLTYYRLPSLIKLYKIREKDLKDCPLSYEFEYMLPHPDNIKDMREFIKGRINFLKRDQGMERIEVINQHIEYYDDLDNKWDLLYNAASTDYPINYRRSSIREYKKLVGDRNYYLNLLPFPDIRLFKIID